MNPDDFYSDEPDQGEEEESHANSLDILPEVHDGEELSDWMSSALESIDGASSLVAISYSGGRFSALQHDKARPDQAAEPPTPKIVDDHDGGWQPPRMSVDEKAELEVALRFANDTPGVELVVIVDANGTLLFDEQDEEAALLAAFIPLIHSSNERLAELLESLIEESPRFEGCRIKLKFFPSGPGGWYVCGLGYPICDLNEVIAGLAAHMRWLLG